MKRFTPFGTAWRQFADARELPSGRSDPPWTGGVDDETSDADYFGWELACCAPGLESGDARAVAALARACLTAMQRGSTRLSTDVAQLSAALQGVGAPDLVGVASTVLTRARNGDPGDPVTQVMGRPGCRTPLIVRGQWLYTERLLRLETEFCERTVRLAGQSFVAPSGERLDRALRVASLGNPCLTEEQQEAVRVALTRPLALITGGPGTGKTTIIIALLRAAQSLSIDDVALAAPTGKAALRMREAAALADPGAPWGDISPMTLHRLLGWSPTRNQFARGECDPLPCRIVIVDEASMVDLVLMDRLVRAMRRGAQLVLFGDSNQLPSVDAGAVFRDLCAVLRPARLNTNLRVDREPSARGIVSIARSLQEGSVDCRLDELAATRQAVSSVVFEGVEHLCRPWTEVGLAFLDRWWDERISGFDDFERRITRVHRAPQGIFDEHSVEDLRALSLHYSKSRILCATRGRTPATGAQALNDYLLYRLREATRQLRPGYARELAPGTPVLVERNDYERDLWNGDQGVVLWVDAGRGPELAAVFQRGEGFIRFSLRDLGVLTPAFALTIHKAQGSEFDHVAVILPDVKSPLATRELLYTAITRARKSVVLVGESQRFADAAARSIARDSGVAEALAAMGC
jgi:exodeoxyribonuclease V alpha subunit